MAAKARARLIPMGLSTVSKAPHCTSDSSTPLIEALGIHARGEIEEIAEWSARVSGLEHDLERRLPHPAERAEPESDLRSQPILQLPRSSGRSSPVGMLVHHGEVDGARVDVRWKNGNTPGARLGDGADDLVDLVLVRGQNGREKFRRVVRLEIAGLVRDERVRGRVALVEAVGREAFHLAEDGHGLLLGDAVVLRALHERGLLLGHLLVLLLAHRSAEHVGATERVAGEALSDLHHLLLVDGHAVGRCQHLVDQWVELADRLSVVLAADEVLDHSGAEGSGSIQSHGGDDVLEAIGFELPEQLPACRSTPAGRRPSCPRS